MNAATPRLAPRSTALQALHQHQPSEVVSFGCLGLALFGKARGPVTAIISSAILSITHREELFLKHLEVIIHQCVLFVSNILKISHRTFA